MYLYHSTWFSISNAPLTAMRGFPEMNYPRLLGAELRGVHGRVDATAISRGSWVCTREGAHCTSFRHPKALAGFGRARFKPTLGIPARICAMAAPPAAWHAIWMGIQSLQGDVSWHYEKTTQYASERGGLPAETGTSSYDPRIPDLETAAYRTVTAFHLMSTRMQFNSNL